MSAIRDYLKTQHLFTMKGFLSPEENPDKKVWFTYDESGKVTGCSIEPVDREWDGTGPKPLIVPMGRFESEQKMTENCPEFVEMAEEEEKKQIGS